MYTAVLVIHNIFRWVVLAAALFALFRAYSGWLGKREWTKTDRLSGTLFSISLDIQFLFGLILYVAGEWYTVFQSMAEAMANETMRFFGLEHLFYMLVAVILVHAGSVLARKAPEDTARHRRAALWFSLVFLILLIAIPWWRPLLRF